MSENTVIIIIGDRMVGHAAIQLCNRSHTLYVGPDKKYTSKIKPHVRLNSSESHTLIVNCCLVM